MTLGEAKGLLLKDLCARMPYGVKLQNVNNIESIVKLRSIDLDNYCFKIMFYTYEGKALTVCKESKLFRFGRILRYKPCLFPLSSMTAEDLKSLYTAVFSDATEIKVTYTEDEDYYEIEVKYGHYTCYYNSDNLLNDINYIGYDWLNAHHYDYRDLIEKGLAISAVNLNIY